ncbi:restriction endonuclease subunit S [Clostridium isatidis]|uniref:restriction endonuclease subunit S n=1 Tax=Clostridium isatidis TaxID=182773 RepID=UPI003AAFE5C9
MKDWCRKMDYNITLPKGWAKLSIVNDLNYIKTGVEKYEGEKEYFSTGSINGNVAIPEGKYEYDKRPSRANRIAKLGDVLQARMKKTDKAILVDKNLDGKLFSTGFFQIRADEKLIHNKYLFYYLKSFNFNKIKDELCSGSTQEALNDQNAKKIYIPVPPINEQRRIANKISELFSEIDKGIENFTNIKKQIYIYRQSILRDAFAGRLTSKWRENNNINQESAKELLQNIKRLMENEYERKKREFEVNYKLWVVKKEGKKPIKPKKKEELAQLTKEELEKLEKLPQGAMWVKLGEIFDIYIGATPSRKINEYWNGDINWVSSGEVNFCKIYDTKEKITKLGLEKSSTEIHPIDTIMLAMIGEGKTRGQVAILKVEAAHNQNTAAIRTHTSGCSPEFLYYFLLFTYELTRTIGSGNNQKALNKNKIENIPYPLFCINEQKKIVEEIELRLSKCESIEKLINETIEKAEALKQSILKKAFEGKLVPQDPNDEPVEELLKQIKAEDKNKKHEIK